MRGEVEAARAVEQAKRVGGLAGTEEGGEQAECAVGDAGVGALDGAGAALASVGVLGEQGLDLVLDPVGAFAGFEEAQERERDRGVLAFEEYAEDRLFDELRAVFDGEGGRGWGAVDVEVDLAEVEGVAVEQEAEGDGVAVEDGAEAGAFVADR